jgi:aldose 1-epimerase
VVSDPVARVLGEAEPSSRFFQLIGPTGLRAEVTNHGARLVRLLVPDAEGRIVDVALGFDTIAEYEAHSSLYFGATVGRVANRTAEATFTLDGVTYQLAANDGDHHLHGGSLRSFDKVVWDVGNDSEASAIEFRHFSPHLEDGYPGNLQVSVTYRLTPEDGLRIDYSATSDRRTPLNLTHHSYWNLGGVAAPETVDDQVLTVFADRYTPTDDSLIPLGRLDPVDQTPLDFRRPTVIGPRLRTLADGPGAGLDHNFVLTEWDSSLRVAAQLHHPGNGLILDLLTTEPGLQVYSSGKLPPTTGKNGVVYPTRGGICLEAQHFPDSVHHPEYPSVLVGPGDTYRQTTEHRFSTV